MYKGLNVLLSFCHFSRRSHNKQFIRDTFVSVMLLAAALNVKCYNPVHIASGRRPTRSTSSAATWRLATPRSTGSGAAWWRRAPRRTGPRRRAWRTPLTTVLRSSPAPRWCAGCATAPSRCCCSPRQSWRRSDDCAAWRSSSRRSTG